VPEPTTFLEYCSDVLAPGEGDNANPMSNVDIDEESRKGRDRVYNLLTLVPLQLERLIDFGFLLLLDVFLSVLTMAPLRAMRAVVTVLYAFLSGRCVLFPH
jgi:CHASE1-domain containing sensor protein